MDILNIEIGFAFQTTSERLFSFVKNENKIFRSETVKEFFNEVDLDFDSYTEPDFSPECWGYFYKKKYDKYVCCWNVQQNKAVIKKIR